MITNNELQISNMSYTEKDFASIYPSLLDLVKQLTNKWDPSISNESDPGNVLLKLLAAIGDKNSYNIDKNVLECFMPSATQETSMRRLTEAVGYNMKYYQSALTEITFKYTDNFEDQIKFDRFDTVVSNSDGTISYTLIEDVALSYKNVARSGLAIEGSLEKLIVGDNEVVKLSNLDDNNRVYFPELYVAQNGIFIANDGTSNIDEWTRVDNLNTQQPLTRCYKFSYDSESGLPYIEFPTDIAQLIGSGLNIWYIITSGAAGNVSAGTLSVLSSTSNTGLNTDNLVIFNASSSTNGSDKETIDEAYSNFKKIIGTFETLVTTRDYANAIYNLSDSYGSPIVSNAQVSDRTNDINNTLKIVSYDTSGKYIELIPNSNMTVSDLALYPLRSYKGENYNVYNPSYVYNQSYLPFKNVGTADLDGSLPYTDDSKVIGGLEDLKCIGQNYKTLHSDNDEKRDIYNIQNVANIDAQIFTYAKVNAVAQADIVSNVIKALSDNFNARKVEYGYEIPYEDILDVIYAADSRIKSVSLSNLEYNPEIMFVDAVQQGDLSGNEPLSENPEIAADIIAKNVLAGKLGLFLYDNRFEWRFGQTDCNTMDNIVTIDTDLNIPMANNIVTGEDSSKYFEYELKDNETIQLVAPSLSTNTIYPAGVYYRFVTSGTDSSDVVVTANSDHELAVGETLYIYYVDSDEQVRTATFTKDSEPNIIRPSFDLYYTNHNSSTNSITYNNVTYHRIDTNQTLETREFVSIKLSNPITPIYWIRNNSLNTLFEAGETEVILDTNEYFIYSNSNLDDLVILGAGTHISRGGSSVDTTQWSIVNPISLDSINLNGLAAFTQGDWQYMNLTSNNFIQIQEMQIITLGTGAVIKISDIDTDGLAVLTSSQPSDWSTNYRSYFTKSVNKYIPNTSSTWAASTYYSLVVLNYEFQDTAGSISYSYPTATDDTVVEIPGSTDSWKIRTRLDLNAGPANPQQIVTDTTDYTKSQIITIWTYNDAGQLTPEYVQGASDDRYLLFNFALSMAGGHNIDAKVTNLLTGVTSNLLSANVYTNVDITDTDTSDGAIDPTTNINLNLDEDKTITLPVDIDYIETEELAPAAQQEDDEYVAVGGYNYLPFGTYIVPMLFTQGSVAPGDTPAALTLTSNCADLYAYNEWSYQLLTSEPADWSENYAYYFTKSGDEYEPVAGDTAPAWASDTYYKYAKTPLNSITVGGLYNIELVAKWIGEYDTLKDLAQARPYAYTPSGGSEIYPNTAGDICKVFTSATEIQFTDGGSTPVTYSAGTYGAGLYQFNGTSHKWELISNSTPDKYNITVDVDITDTQLTESFLTIGKIRKILSLNAAITESVGGQVVLDRIGELVDGAVDAEGNKVTFYYVYLPENSDVIECDDMASAEAFWDVNNIANRFTLPRIDLENSKIYVARSSQL